MAIIVGNFPWSDELAEKFIDLWQKNECLQDVSSSQSSSVVAAVYRDTTQLNWASSWVELCRYKWSFILYYTSWCYNGQVWNSWLPDNGCSGNAAGTQCDKTVSLFHV